MDKNLTDNEIIKAREVSLKEQIEHYNERKKEVFDSYYRRNTEGNEDTLEICVLRESAVLISKLESIINRLQEEKERLIVECGNQSTLWSKHFEGIFETAKETIKAEAYKEFAERLIEKYGYYDWENKTIVYPEDEINNLLKELVGDK